MKNALFNGFLLTIILFFNLYGQCTSEPEETPAITLTGTWETYYFEHNGMDVSNQYKLNLRFSDQGKCFQILTKPGATVSELSSFHYNEAEGILTIGAARLQLVRYDGTSLRLRYLDGAQPAGYMQPWSADFIVLE